MNLTHAMKEFAMDNGDEHLLQTAEGRAAYAKSFTTASRKKPAQRKKAATKSEFKALTGSAKQKLWAEKLRAERRHLMNDEQFAFMREFEVAKSAKFWIDTRNDSDEEFMTNLVNTMNHLKEKERALAEIRAKYQ